MCFSLLAELRLDSFVSVIELLKLVTHSPQGLDQLVAWSIDGSSSNFVI